VGGNETNSTTGTRTTTVTGDETLTCDANRTKTITGNETSTITGDRGKTVQGNEKSITGDRTKTVNGDEFSLIKQNQKIEVGASEGVNVTEDSRITSGALTHKAGPRKDSVGETHQIQAFASMTTEAINHTLQVGEVHEVESDTSLYEASSITINGSWTSSIMINSAGVFFIGPIQSSAVMDLTEMVGVHNMRTVIMNDYMAALHSI